MIKRLGIVLFSFLLLSGCNGSDIKRSTELEKEFHSAINTVSDNRDSEVYIKTLANFKWDKAFLINPYTSQEEIEKQISVTFKDPSNINSRDDIYLLIFLHQGKVIQYAEIDRLKSSLSLGEKAYLTPSDDVIYIER
ncbi:hypothetical protein [Lysinibacillus odysseyi]|uniref:Lipoprotein n=1 Tax=Lysinibacillus odysseyi 34hs-1 = NBRC 100172 TaxID=1220589 RepID=A0A0A3JER1_9BACI|nr:hypothetical protein [Lysinibacillus odysseyi]KGR85537.1 hypothetical protein CD32_10020 [Lysinibacillus odysseyi 34hs-1 = NBRC 100172]